LPNKKSSIRHPGVVLDGTERYYHGVGTGIPKLTSAESDPDWRSVIHFPGKSGGHYRIGKLARFLSHIPHQSTPFPQRNPQESTPQLSL
jgi:hypothetical protein